MAECSYTRCLQNRRLIKRELQKWTKDMVYIVGLERVAEELMGRRKWKLYQEVLARSQLNVNNPNLAQNETTEKEKINLTVPATLVENHSKENEVVTIKNEISENEVHGKLSSTAERGNTGEPIVEDPVDNSSSSGAIKVPDSSDSPSYPIDWKPTDKCYFCVDGKLLTVNEQGELVAESGSAPSETELANRVITTQANRPLIDFRSMSQPALTELNFEQASLDSDSDTSESSRDIDSQNPTATNAPNKTMTSLLRDSLPPNMISLESLANRLATVASLQGLQSGLAQLYPSLWYHQLAQQVLPTVTTPTSEQNVDVSPTTLKESPSPSETTGEQPLDLSAKPSPNSSLSGGDPKQVFRAKPRPAITGRRTYTEDELNNALQDIMSGRLGTRRAAVLYGIPRSTLRNKVYKIAMEQKREASALNTPVLEALVDPDDEDKELSGDDEKDEKLLGVMPDDLSRFSDPHLLNRGCDNSQSGIKTPGSMETQIKLQSAQTPQPQTPPIVPNPWLDPKMLLQLLAGMSAIPELTQPKPEDTYHALLELFSNQTQEYRKEQMKNSPATSVDSLLNSKINLADPRTLLQTLPLLQQHHQLQQHQQQKVQQQQSLHHHHQQQQQQQHHQQQLQQQQTQPFQTQLGQHSAAAHHYQNRSRKSETPETASSTDMNEVSDDPSVILKIPSYKPAAGSSSSAGKNGDNLSSPASQATPPIIARSPQQINSLPGISPPLIRQSSESQSPPVVVPNKSILSLKDVITSSISRTFSQQSNKDINPMKSTTPSMESMDQYKHATISVIKNIGGTDITRFGAPPNLLSNPSANNSANALGMGSNNVGGKGTRPKRGKYRNYDRDSLVEAVKAVQRGEMSVHRAGSYYGVPHSTLEYKVKERHLMRPRKREPKPQPLDDRSGSSNSNSTNSKIANIPGSATVSSLDKSKSVAAQKASLKNPSYSNSSPNGMKLPIFDSAMAAYAQQLLWQPHQNFGSVPIDFTRAAPGFAPNAESFIASQMMQRYHEETARHNQANAAANLINTTTNSGTHSATTNNAKSHSTANNTNIPGGIPNVGSAAGIANKNVRELSESLYDGSSTNGLFLDGIIRKTLDRKPGDLTHSALFDQLAKINRKATTTGNSTISGTVEDHLMATGKTKRPSSPMHFPAVDIKRERSSPATVTSCDTTERISVERDISRESVESLLKMRDGLTLKMEEKHHHQQQHHQQSQSRPHSQLSQHSQHQSPHISQHQHLSQHLQQQLQQPTNQQIQSSSANSNLLQRLAVEDLNGGRCDMHEKLEQLKSEPEDSL